MNSLKGRCKLVKRLNKFKNTHTLTYFTSKWVLNANPTYRTIGETPIYWVTGSQLCLLYEWNLVVTS